MAKRNIANIYNPPKSNVQFTEGQKSKGILDDYAERKALYMPLTAGSVIFAGAKGELYKIILRLQSRV